MDRDFAPKIDKNQKIKKHLIVYIGISMYQEKEITVNNFMEINEISLK